MPVAKGLLGRFAPGLLSLLDLKTRGFNPDTLSDVVQPTMDVSQWYGVDTTEKLFAWVNLPAGSASVYANVLLPTNPAVPIVPEGELWRVRDFAVALEGTVATAAANYNIRELRPVLDLRGAANLNHRVFGASSSPIRNTDLVPTAGFYFPSPSMRDVWAPAGTRFLVYFAGTTIDATNARTINVMVQFDRLKV